MTDPASSEDERYQRLQDIYLKWHSRRRPLSGFICELKAELEQAEAAARIDENMQWADLHKIVLRDLGNHGSFTERALQQVITEHENRLAQLRTDAGGGKV